MQADNIFGKVYSSAGAPSSADFLVSSFMPDFQSKPALAFAPSGDFVVAWSSTNQAGSAEGVFGQRYCLDPLSSVNVAAFGSLAVCTNSDPGGLAFVTDTGGALNTHQWGYKPSLGGVFVPIAGQTGTSYTIKGSDFASGPPGSYYLYCQTTPHCGTPAESSQTIPVTVGVGQGARAQEPLGAEFRVNETTQNAQYAPSVVWGPNTFIVTWSSDGQDGSSRGVYARRYATAGPPVGGEFLVNTYTTNEQRFSRIYDGGFGGLVVAWQRTNQDDPTGSGVYAQRFDLGASPLGTEFLVNTTTTSFQAVPSVARAGAGFVVVWQSYLQDGSGAGVFAQRYGSAGGLQGSEFRVNSSTTSQQSRPFAASSVNQGFVVVWASSGQDGSGYGVFAQRFTSAG